MRRPAVRTARNPVAARRSGAGVTASGREVMYGVLGRRLQWTLALVAVVSHAERAQDVPPDQVLVDAARTRGRGIDQAAHSIIEPAREVDDEGDVRDAALVDRERWVELVALVRIEARRVGKRSSVEGTRNADALAGKVGVRREEFRLVRRHFVHMVRDRIVGP